MDYLLPVICNVVKHTLVKAQAKSRINVRYLVRVASYVFHAVYRVIL
jgi:hypothetical protein